MDERLLGRRVPSTAAQDTITDFLRAPVFEASPELETWDRFREVVNAGIKEVVDVYNIELR